MTPTSRRKGKAPQKEERVEEPRRRNPFQVIADSLNKIRERCGRTWKVDRSACAVVGAEGEDTLVETLKELPQRQVDLDLESKNAKLKKEVKRLKEELEDKRKANLITATKLGKSMELVQKMEGVVHQPADILNKAKLFDAGLAENPITAAKVIPVLVDFNQKMDELLMDMRALFGGLEVSGLVPLDQVPNISINTEELPTWQEWNAGSQAQTPTPMKPAATSEPTPRQVQEEARPSKGPEPKPVTTPMVSGSPQRLTLEEMSITARRILTENPEITQRMFEHLQTQVGPDQLPVSPNPVGDTPSTVNRGSPSVCLNQQRFEQSPRGRFLLTPRQGVEFTLGIGQETSSFRIDMEGMSSEQPTPMEEQPATVEEDPVPREEPTIVPREEPEREAG